MKCGWSNKTHRRLLPYLIPKLDKALPGERVLALEGLKSDLGGHPIEGLCPGFQLSRPHGLTP